jgi:hypothetical protein
MRLQKIMISMLLGMAMFSAHAQYTDEDYMKLNKTAKKPNVVHLLLNGGLGISSSQNIHMRSRSVLKFTNTGATQVKSDTSFENFFVALLQLNFQAELVETRRFYFSVSGTYNYGYFPGKFTTSILGVYSTTKGNNMLEDWEVSGALGTGGNGFKIYSLFGLGATQYTSKKSNSMDFPATNSNPAFKSDSRDTVDYFLRYQKLGLGFRFGSNRRETFDILAYKLIPGKSFFANGEKPGMMKMLTEFGEQENGNPPYPFGISATYIRMGKYKLSADYKVFRDKDFRSKNANAITLVISKNINIYEQKKK